MIGRLPPEQGHRLLNDLQSMPPHAVERPCKVVLLTEIISPYRIPVFNALARIEQVDLHVIFLAETDATQRQWLIYKNEIQFSYEVLESWRRRVGGYHLLLNRGLAASLRRARPDAIICGGYNYLASWQTLWWARRNRVPLLLWSESTLADRRNRHRLIEFLKRQFMKNCQAFVVAGKSSQEYVRKFGAADTSIFMAPDAVDTEFFAARAAEVGEERETCRQSLGLPPRFFLFVGRLVQEKGVFDLLHAYSALPEDVRRAIGLVFAGDGVDRNRLEREAAPLAAGAVKFPGFIQREALPDYYALADAFVFPTHSDPWGLVVNEAMACSLPIICSQAAGCAADLVTDGWNGRLVRAQDMSQLQSALFELAQDADLRQRMGANSWERIQLYSPAACAAGLASATQSSGVRCHD
jgi:glycosyltransferase involved in cell wall biosynthesis